jgi:hypothetical protein
MSKRNQVEMTRRMERATREEVFQIIKPMPNPTSNPQMAARGMAEADWPRETYEQPG